MRLVTAVRESKIRYLGQPICVLLFAFCRFIQKVCKYICNLRLIPRCSSFVTDVMDKPPMLTPEAELSP